MNGRGSASDDQLVRDRLRQTLLQSIQFKHSVKVNAILALEVDGEPPRCIVVEETISEGDRTKLWAQTSLNLANSLFGGAAGEVVANGLLSQMAPELSFLTQNHPEHIPAPSATFSSSSSKRKSGKPCKIPQEGALDLSLGDTVSQYNEAKIEATSWQNSGSSGTLRNMLNGAHMLSSGMLPQQILQQSTTATNTMELLHAAKTAAAAMNSNSGSLFSFPMQSCLPVFRTQQAKKVSLATNGTSGNATSAAPKRSGSSKVFSCNQCKEPFNSLNQLCKHTFSNHRAFRCTICGANFTQRSNLQRHSLKHVGFKPFICNVCDKAYYRKDHLVRHIEVTHPDVDPKASITVKLTSSECLDYLEKLQRDGVDIKEESASSPNEHKSEINQGQFESPLLVDCPSIESSMHADIITKVDADGDDNSLQISGSYVIPQVDMDNDNDSLQISGSYAIPQVDMDNDDDSLQISGSYEIPQLDMDNEDDSLQISGSYLIPKDVMDADDSSSQIPGSCIMPKVDMDADDKNCQQISESLTLEDEELDDVVQCNRETLAFCEPMDEFNGQLATGD